MKANYPYQIDEVDGMAVTSDLEPKLVLFEDKYYELYQRVGNAIFADLFHKMHSNIRQFFPLEEVQKRETYFWFEDDALVGSIRVYHNKEENCYEIERVMVTPQAQRKGYGTKLLNFMVAKLQ